MSNPTIFIGKMLAPALSQQKEIDNRCTVAKAEVPYSREVKVEQTHVIKENAKSDSQKPKSKKRQENCQRIPEAGIRIGYRVQKLKPWVQEQGQAVTGSRHSLGCLFALNLLWSAYMDMNGSHTAPPFPTNSQVSCPQAQGQNKLARSSKCTILWSL